ncbi:MAG: ABC transporter permease [Methanomicrobiales archaeon]|nr:ABC transporter permease [Methanomicrobiales archaeon]
MTYLIGVAVFGIAAIFFLWIRDIRLFLTTTLPGYRKAAYRGVLFTTLATTGFFFAYYDDELIGLGIILGALYLQGRVEREKIWTVESTWERFIGKCRCKKDKGTKEK